MSQSEAQMKAARKYREKFEYIQARLPEDEKVSACIHAESMGESLNTFVRRAIAETIERDNHKKTVK